MLTSTLSISHRQLPLGLSSSCITEIAQNLCQTTQELKYRQRILRLLNFLSSSKFMCLLFLLAVAVPNLKKLPGARLKLSKYCSSVRSVPHTSTFPDTGVCYLVQGAPEGFTINPTNTDNLYIEIADSQGAVPVPPDGIPVPKGKSALLYRSNKKSITNLLYSCLAGSVFIVFVIFMCTNNSADVFPDLPPPPPEPARPLPGHENAYPGRFVPFANMQQQPITTPQFQGPPGYQGPPPQYQAQSPYQGPDPYLGY